MIRAVPLLLLFIYGISGCYAATFGTVVPVVGGVSDLVLDEARQRLYLVNPNRNQVEVYSVAQRRFLNAIPVEQQPLAAAISRNGKLLYVTCHTGAALNIIDLDQAAVTGRIGMPARPEGVAVGGDERVLISTVGTGTGNTANVLLIYDPFVPAGGQSLIAVTVPPPPPANPLAPPNNSNRPALSNRSFLKSSRDGRYIIGVNIPNTTNQAVFVYEVASGVVLRSRTVTGVSSVLSVAPDGSKFMAGLNLFETATLTILAQQNAANSPYPFANGTNFNTQQNQGGSVFSPDGRRIYSAFNFAPVTTPATRANVSQLMINDPDNLLIQTALQMPENLAGQMVVSADGVNAFVISESGFVSLPLGQMSQNPIADLDQTVVLLANDQCGVTADLQTARLDVRNRGAGRFTTSASLLQQTNTGPAGIAGGAGGGAVGGGVVIIVPPVTIPGQTAPPAATLPGGQQTGTNVSIANTAPRVQIQNTASGSTLTISYNTVNRGIGTVSPVHQYVVQSNEAINIPPTIQIFQNYRNTEARGDIVPVDVGLSANEGLVDMALDSGRQRLYIANSGKNRIEVFDTRTRTLLTPIRVGQLPRAMAVSPDGQTLYVANSGGESISIIDLEKREVVGRVKFPALPFNGTAALLTPQLMAAGQRGPLVIMNDGSLWRIIGNEIVPRTYNAGVIPLTNNRQLINAPRTMAASPGGEVILVFSSQNGTAYLYDSTSDDFVQSRQITTANAAGYRGPVSVGPRGQYFLVNDMILNASLTPVGSAAGATTRPVAAVTATTATQFARFVMPVIANANAVTTLTDAGTVELVDANTGNTVRSSSALERVATTAVGNTGVAANGRTMAVDGNSAYLLTASGLSIVSLDPPPPVTSRPTLNTNGIVNSVNYSASIAQGSYMAIFGRNLADQAVAGTTPLPTRLGGVCVTMNNVPLPLLLTSPDQINAYIPQDQATGRFPIVVRSISRGLASTQATAAILKTAPTVFADATTKRAFIFHPDGRPVTPDNPAQRDRSIILYAAGLGPTTPIVRGAVASPSSPLAEAADLQVFFGTPTINGAEIIVDWAGLVPGYIGLYQLNLRVPGNHLRGDALPVTIKMGSVSSAAGPVVAVD
jgi:uncharacterized protein (TIGR03437 family)